MARSLHMLCFTTDHFDDRMSVSALLLLWSVHSLAPGLCMSRLILQLARPAPEDAALVHVSILSSSAKRSKITCNATLSSS